MYGQEVDNVYYHMAMTNTKEQRQTGARFLSGILHSYSYLNLCLRGVLPARPHDEAHLFTCHLVQEKACNNLK